jgi:hypothetical protein
MYSPSIEADRGVGRILVLVLTIPREVTGIDRLKPLEFSIE